MKNCPKCFCSAEKYYYFATEFFYRCPNMKCPVSDVEDSNSRKYGFKEPEKQPEVEKEEKTEPKYTLHEPDTSWLNKYLDNDYLDSLKPPSIPMPSLPKQIERLLEDHGVKASSIMIRPDKHVILEVDRVLFDWELEGIKQIVGTKNVSYKVV